MTGSTVAAIAAVGGLVSLERKTFAQFMISRPIVVAPLLAAMLGDAHTGFALGIPLELMFLGNSSFGASTPYHETLAALFAASLGTTAILSAANEPDVILPLAFFLSLPWALLGRWMEARQERWNSGLVTRAEEILAHGQPGVATRHVLIGVLGTVLLGSFVAVLGTLLGPVLGAIQRNFPLWLRHGLTFAWPMVYGTSAALAIRVIRTPKGGALAAFAAAMVFVAWGVVTYSLQ